MTIGDAARNNAELCDIVCRTHNVVGAFAPDAWTSAERTPPLYPDAVTLRPGVSASGLLARIDGSPGCSIKDSFADLDLGPHGFEILFAAEWIQRPPTKASGDVPPWIPIVDDAVAGPMVGRVGRRRRPDGPVPPGPAPSSRHRRARGHGRPRGGRRRAGEPQRARRRTVERLRDDRRARRRLARLPRRDHRDVSRPPDRRATNRPSRWRPRGTTGSPHWGRCGSGSDRNSNAWLTTPAATSTSPIDQPRERVQVLLAATRRRGVPARRARDRRAAPTRRRGTVPRHRPATRTRIAASSDGSRATPPAPASGMTATTSTTTNEIRPSTKAAADQCPHAEPGPPDEMRPASRPQPGSAHWCRRRANWSPASSSMI